jgi:hypothetical protein
VASAAAAAPGDNNATALDRIDDDDILTDRAKDIDPVFA